MNIKTNISWLVTISMFIINFNHLQAQSNPLPIELSIRKSLFGGSFVLQVKNVSMDKLIIYLEAKGKIDNFVISAGATKEIGWAQGFRFDANDLYFLRSNGYDTVKKTMPSNELSPWRISITKEGGLSVNVSQTYLQEQLPKYLILPINRKLSKHLDLTISDYPQIELKDGSDRIFATTIIRAKILSGKLNIPIKSAVSFIPFYSSTLGVIGASQVRVENIDVNLVPKEWLDEIAKAVNLIAPILFENLEIRRLTETEKRYFELFNVREIIIRDGRIEILIL